MLAIPARLTRDLAQFQLGDEPSVTRGEKQNVFLDRRRQMHQNHDLRKTRRGNVTQSRELGVGDRARDLPPATPLMDHARWHRFGGTRTPSVLSGRLAYVTGITPPRPGRV